MKYALLALLLFCATLMSNIGLHYLLAASSDGPTSLDCPFQAPDVNLPLMHDEIRQLLITAFNRNTATPRGALLMNGGFVTSRYDTDVEQVFRQESNFLYITGYSQPNATVLIDLAAGRATLFVEDHPEDYAIWNGQVESPAAIEQEYGFQEVLYRRELAGVLAGLSGGDSSYPVYVMDEYVTFAGQESVTVDSSKLKPVLYARRMEKTNSELELMRYAAAVSSGAHENVMSYTQPGLYEYNIEGRFLDGCFACGLMVQAYIPICASGNNSAILHYVANDRLMENGDLLLLDAGAEYKGYGTDITRTYPVNGEYSPDQKEVYNMVLEIQYRVIQRVYPGQTLTTLQGYCIEYTCDHLTSYGFLSSSVELCVEERLYRYFYPHGVSHFIGIDVHDRYLTKTLGERMVITVEPGIYFNEALLGPVLSDPELGQYFVAEKIRPLLDQQFGGVRIEDVVVVWADGPEVISFPPKTVFAVETQMQA